MPSSPIKNDTNVYAESVTLIQEQNQRLWCQMDIVQVYLCIHTSNWYLLYAT